MAGQQHYYTTTKTPIGEVVLTSDGSGLTGLYTAEHSYFKQAKSGTAEAKYFTEAVKQLEEYFAGKRKDFDIELSARGTEFQNKVWKALRGIGYGKTKTYGEIAGALKKPTASRAVGMANGKNPISIIVPCHRVIGASGKLTGYAGGVKAKLWLLEHEKKTA